MTNMSETERLLQEILKTLLEMEKKIPGNGAHPGARLSELATQVLANEKEEPPPEKVS